MDPSINKMTKYLMVFVLSVLSTCLNASEINRSNKHYTYLLGSGDRLKVFVSKHPELSIQVIILPDGNIGYPLIGEVNASGLSAEDIAKTISLRLEEHILYPKVTVIPVELHSYRIYVLGEVNTPGEYELNAPVNILQALAMSGGFTPYATRKNIRIINTLVKDRLIIFNYKKFINNIENDYENVTNLKPGDTILVP